MFNIKKGILEFVDIENNCLTINGKIYHFLNPNLKIKIGENFNGENSITFVLSKGLISEIKNIQDEVIDISFRINNEDKRTFYQSKISLYFSFFIQTFRDYTNYFIYVIGLYIFVFFIIGEYELIAFSFLSFAFLIEWLDKVTNYLSVNFSLDLVILEMYLIFIFFISLVSYFVLLFSLRKNKIKIIKNKYNFYQSVFVNLYLLGEKND